MSQATIFQGIRGTLGLVRKPHTAAVSTVRQLAIAILALVFRSEQSPHAEAFLLLAFGIVIWPCSVDF